MNSFKCRECPGTVTYRLASKVLAPQNWELVCDVCGREYILRLEPGSIKAPVERSEQEPAAQEAPTFVPPTPGPVPASSFLDDRMSGPLLNYCFEAPAGPPENPYQPLQERIRAVLEYAYRRGFSQSPRVDPLRFARDLLTHLTERFPPSEGCNHGLLLAPGGEEVMLHLSFPEGFLTVVWDEADREATPEQLADFIAKHRQEAAAAEAFLQAARDKAGVYN